MILAATLASAVVALASSAVRTDVFPGRGGESGILDVPTADVLAPRSGTLASELSISRVPGTVGMTVSPFPLSIVTGVANGLEAGVALRHWGRPGDPAPTPTLFAGALKLHLADAASFRPALAIDAYVDRANGQGTAGARAIATSPAIGRIRVSAFAGADRLLDASTGLGATAGIAGSLDVADRLDLVADALLTRDGPMTGAALRWQLTPAMGVTLGCDWVPREGGLRLGFGFAVAARPARRAPAAAATRSTIAFDAPARAPAAPPFTDDRPHFRMRLDLPDGAPRREHFVAISPAERAAAAQEQSNAAVAEGAAGRERAAEVAATTAGAAPAERRAALQRRSDRLAATRERLEAVDVALTAAGSRVDAVERRLALQADRVALLERRARTAGAAAVEAPAAAATSDSDQRRAVLAHHAEIEDCIAGGLPRRSLVRADGVLRVRVDADGHVTEVSYATEAGAKLDDACLEKAARTWSLPHAAAGYALDVPITVVTAGAKP